MTGYQRAWVAILAGSLISVALFTAAYSFPHDFLYWPQAVGFYACIVLRGIHTATKTDFAIIGIPVNAAIYAVALFGLMHILAGKKAPKSSTN
jgi:hypothetical protein